MTRALPILSMLSMTLLAVASARADQKPLPTVPYVDLSRYLGTWYEIARLPTRFEKDCVAVTATYARRDDGQVSVVNHCRKLTLTGEDKESTGRAKVVDETSFAKLKVTFFWPFWGDYWILDLGANYEHALVGEPDREYLWILARTPTLPEPTYQALLERARSLGYDVSTIYKTPQPADAPTQAVPR
jgi:apolipoprotein D and lipocalin family protein